MKKNRLHIPISSTSSSSTSLSQYQPPIKRVANERERTRTASVNDAFLMLRNLIPTEPMNRKLSKIETLRLASSYISHLHAILITGSGPADQPCLKHQQIYHLETTHNDISMLACKTDRSWVRIWRGWIVDVHYRTKSLSSTFRFSMMV
ncbi:unnamed protein product [Schistosoma margrebowiei]|uniref:Uncharacterized protein n=1 Tax=Schistosoma margrebowiei TaxID=48269 RepID=A0A183MLF4_9TREM|nr:unnamed protein product [Schistosoma margrebowiei]